jgi:excisionase family DNA binding protein
MPIDNLINELQQTLPSILDVTDICSILSISPDTVYREIQNGALSAYKAEGEWCVLRSDFLDYLERNATV